MLTIRTGEQEIKLDNTNSSIVRGNQPGVVAVAEVVEINQSQ